MVDLQFSASCPLAAPMSIGDRTGVLASCLPAVAWEGSGWLPFVLHYRQKRHHSIVPILIPLTSRVFITIPSIHPPKNPLVVLLFLLLPFLQSSPHPATTDSLFLASPPFFLTRPQPRLLSYSASLLPKDENRALKVSEKRTATGQ